MEINEMIEAKRWHRQYDRTIRVHKTETEEIGDEYDSIVDRIAEDYGMEGDYALEYIDGSPMMIMNINDCSKPCDKYDSEIDGDWVYINLDGVIKDGGCMGAGTAGASNARYSDKPKKSKTEKSLVEGETIGGLPFDADINGHIMSTGDIGVDYYGNRYARYYIDHDDDLFLDIESKYMGNGDNEVYRYRINTTPGIDYPSPKASFDTWDGVEDYIRTHLIKSKSKKGVEFAVSRMSRNGFNFGHIGENSWMVNGYGLDGAVEDGCWLEELNARLSEAGLHGSDFDVKMDFPEYWNTMANHVARGRYTVYFYMDDSLIKSKV